MIAPLGPNKAELWKTCGELDAETLEYIYDHSKEVVYRTFQRHVDHISFVRLLRKLGYNHEPGPRKGLRIHQDPYVSFFHGELPDGRECWNMEWSCIDHIFVVPEGS